MNTYIDYCGVIVLLRKLIYTGLLTREEAEKTACRVAIEAGINLIISL